MSGCRNRGPDLEVPAGAEIIIEGEILAEEQAPEGPFGEFTGYASYRSTNNIFVAKRLRMRREPLFHSIASGMSSDHILISCITREGEILNSLRRNLPNVQNVHVPHTTCGAFMVFVSLKKTAEGEAHHQIETFIEFFCYFWPLDVDRDREVAFVEDAVEHINTFEEITRSRYSVPQSSSVAEIASGIRAQVVSSPRISTFPCARDFPMEGSTS